MTHPLTEMMDLREEFNQAMAVYGAAIQRFKMLAYAEPYMLDRINQHTDEFNQVIQQLKERVK